MKNKSLIIVDPKKFNQDVRELLSKIIPQPNKDILSVTVNYDPNLNVVTLKYWSLGDDQEYVVSQEVLD